jgi:hypothetical protein
VIETGDGHLYPVIGLIEYNYKVLWSRVDTLYTDLHCLILDELDRETDFYL